MFCARTQGFLVQRNHFARERKCFVRELKMLLVENNTFTSECRYFMQECKVSLQKQHLYKQKRECFSKKLNIYLNVNALNCHFLLLNSQICLYFPFKIPKVCTFLWMWWHIVSQLDTNPLKSIKHVKNGCTGAIRSAPSELDYAAGCINVRHLCLFFCLIWEGKRKLCDGTSESVSICLSLFQQGSG